MEIYLLIFLLIKGIFVGFAIAAPIGGVAVLTIKRSLNGHYFHALSTGFGSAAADVFFASCAAFGLASIAEWMSSYEIAFKICGIVLLSIIGAKLIMAKPFVVSSENHSDTTMIRAFISAFFLTFTNPIMVIAFAAAFTAVGIDNLDDNILQPLSLILGVSIGATAWWMGLATSISMMRRAISPKAITIINRTSGFILLAFSVYIISTLLN